MTEKRFRYDGVDIEDNVEMVEYAICTSEGGSKVTGLLNELVEENEQLKQSIDNLMDSDAWWEKKAKQRVEELEKENEQLKLQLDYIQLSITEAIQHSKTELEQDALKKVIENYNEYMLGHKEVSE